MSYLVDTNVFSELVKPKPDDCVAQWLRDQEPELCISLVTIGENRRDIEGRPVGKRKTGLQSWLTGLWRICEWACIPYFFALLFAL